MKQILILGFLFFLYLPCQAQQPMTKAELVKYAQQKNQEVVQLWQQKQIAKAVAILEGLYATPNMNEVEGAWLGVLYNLACGYSLLGQKEKALSFFRDAAEAGYSDYDQIQRDTDFDNIREDLRFKEIMVKLKAKQTFWENPDFKTPYRENISNDEKIAGLSKFWSEAKYNFANFSLVPNLNWDSLYVAYLPKVQQTKSTLEYYMVLRELCAQLKDGHTDVYNLSKEISESYCWPPIRTRLVEDKVLIVDVFDDSLRKSGITSGLEILSVDGMPVKQYAEERVMPYQCASTQQDLMEKAYRALLVAPTCLAVTLELADKNGKTFTWKLARGTSSALSRPLLEFKLLRKNIAYVALNTFGDNSVVARFDSLFPQIEKTDAFIIDLRNNGGGNSGTGWSILGYLTDKPFKTSQWKTRDYRPAYRAWGQGEKWYVETDNSFPPHGSKFYTKPVIVLTSPRTYSAAEDFCVAFDFMKRGTIVGEPTGGSTGQPLIFSLPGGGGAGICSKHDSYPDGKEFVGVGVQPDILVHPTVKDVRSGRDTVLEAALEYLKKATKKT